MRVRLAWSERVEDAGDPDSDAGLGMEEPSELLSPLLRVPVDIGRAERVRLATRPRVRPVHGTGGREYDRVNRARRRARLEQCLRPLDIRPDRVERIRFAKGNEVDGREMDHLLRARLPEKAGQRLDVADVDGLDINCRYAEGLEIPTASYAEVVYDDDVFAPLHEVRAEVRADEAATAGHHRLSRADAHAR